MLAYFDLLQRVASFPPAGKGDHCWCCSSPHFSDDFLAQAKELFDQAQADAEDEAVRKRVRQAQLSLDYLELVRAKKFPVRKWRLRARRSSGRKKSLPVFDQPGSQSFGITDLGEGWTLEKENKNFAYVKSYPVKTLENSSVYPARRPDLSGRVIQMVDKRTGPRRVGGSQIPKQPSYPDVSGLVFSVLRGLPFPKPLEVKWQAGCELVESSIWC